MQSMIGQSLGRYRILSLLAEGGMGEVYKAHDPVLQRDVAIKVMHPHFARQPNFRERFLQEARTAARLDHSCIVKVHDSGEADGCLYIVMEFIPGANLRKILEGLRASNRWILLPEAVQLIRQVCLALDYAHRQGVLHRDIKPDNIMLKPEPLEGLPYRPVLTDLGLAKLLEGLPLTHEGESMGTPAYMSPEQSLGEPLDARSDVYSVGILLYELAAGRLPFPVRTLSEAIRYHTKESPPPPRTIRPDLPPETEKVILKALEKDPVDRYPNAKELAVALESLLTVPSVPGVEEAAASLVMANWQSPEPQTMVDVVETPSPPVAQPSTQDTIQLIVSDQTMRTLPVKLPAMTIGRVEGNDIVLDDPKASRRHARLEFDGVNYRIVDLNSTNGTFLDKTRLSPGVMEIWTPGKMLTIGKCSLLLERSQPPVTSTATQTEGTTMVDGGELFSAGASSKIGLFLEKSQYSVLPGNSAQMKVILINQGGILDRLQTSMDGLPVEWVSLPPEVRLAPGAQQEVTITVHPPRSPKSLAGPRELTLRVSSLDDPARNAQINVNLNIETFVQVELDLQPKKQSSTEDGNFAVLVQNRGNIDLDIQLEAVDAEGGCVCSLIPSQVPLATGQEHQVQLKVQPKTPLVGQQVRAYPFTVMARLAGVPGLIGQVQGSWEQTPYVGRVSQPGPLPQVQMEQPMPPPFAPNLPSQMPSFEGQPLVPLLPKRSVWRFFFAWLFLVAGWGLASMIVDRFMILFVNIGGIPGFFTYTLGLPEVIGLIIQAVVFGVMYGILVGLVTALALRWAEPSFPIALMLVITVAWGIGWGLWLPGLFEYISVPVNPRIFPVIATLIGGLATGLALRGTRLSLSGWRTFALIIVWPIGQFVANAMIASGLFDFGRFYEIYRFDLTGVISSGIAGGLTMLVLWHARKVLNR